MTREFKLPDLGEGLTEGEIGRWLVQEGQQIVEDDPLVEIATDKTTVEIPSPYTGTVMVIHVAEGDVVPVGTTLVTIEAPVDIASISVVAESKAEPLPRPEHEPSATSAVRATPLVRRIASERGIDLTTISGTGRNGQITERDLNIRAEREVPIPSNGERRERLRGVRRQTSERLAISHREVPAVTFVEECDFTDIDLSRLVALALRAVSASLKEFPELNARLEGQEVVYIDRYDIGVAVQTPHGLLVPVVRNCDTRDLYELDLDIRRLAEAARAGTLDPKDLRGGTFTVTSAGKLGGVLVTPLVNHPEVAILGLHRVADRPVARNGEITIRRMGHVSVTFDHRVIDGARAAEFCLQVINRLQLTK